jgi:hypothetical protein
LNPNDHIPVIKTTEIHGPLCASCSYLLLTSSFFSIDDGIFKDVGDTYICWDKTAVENIPSDVNAFFGHPLTAATNAIEGADSLALLHEYQNEYQNLPPMDSGKEQYHYIEVGDDNK